MRLRNLFIDRVLRLVTIILTKVKTRAWNYDEFLVFYVDYLKRNNIPSSTQMFPVYSEIKRLFVFEKLQNETFIKFIAEGQDKGHLIIHPEYDVPDFREIVRSCKYPSDYLDIIGEAFYPKPDDSTIHNFLPTPTDLCEPYIKGGRKKKRYDFYKNIALIFAFIVSVLTVWNHFFGNTNP